MPKNEPTIKEVLKDKSLIGGGVAEERAPCKALCERNGSEAAGRIFKGNLREPGALKHFYRRLCAGTAPSYSLIIRRALDLLERRISSMSQMRDLYDEKYLFSLLSSEGRKAMSHEKTGDQNS